MKKEQQGENRAPKVTKLPSASAEAPLVIDLPDGQKLVVGNIPNGTVIEVATWRGTGRPDSRTNRMMLGVSNAEVSIDNEEAPDNRVTSGQNPTSNVIEKIVNFPKIFILWLLNKEPSKPKKPSSQTKEGEFKNSKKFDLKNLIKLKKSKTDFGRNELETKAYGETVSDETNEWLDSILGKSRERAGISTQESKELSPSVSKSQGTKKAPVKRKASPKSKRPIKR